MKQSENRDEREVETNGSDPVLEEISEAALAEISGGDDGVIYPGHFEIRAR